MKKKFADIATLKTIPIVEVARMLGMELKKTGIGVWNEKSEHDRRGYTSLTIFENKNKWWRYSSSSGGSVIDLVMHVRECDFRAACEYLSSSFPNYR